MTLSGAERQTMADHIYDRLRSDIIRLKIKPGHTLSEADVARRFEVSRQPVREAFIQLSDDGFLLIRPQRPTMVKPISKVAVLNACFIRQAIEVAVIAEAARIWDRDAATELEACIAEQIRASEEDDREEFHAADERFHQVLSTRAGYPFAWKAVDQHKAQMDRLRHLTLGYRTPKTIAEHRDIAAALVAKDVDAAIAAMRRHLRRIEEDLIEASAVHADYFDTEAPDSAAQT